MFFKFARCILRWFNFCTGRLCFEPFVYPSSYVMNLHVRPTRGCSPKHLLDSCTDLLLCLAYQFRDFPTASSCLNASDCSAILNNGDAFLNKQSIMSHASHAIIYALLRSNKVYSLTRAVLITAIGGVRLLQPLKFPGIR